MRGPRRAAGTSREANFNTTPSRLQNFLGRFTHNDGISRSAHEGNYCPPVPSVISKERGYVVEICVDGLSAFVGALDPGAYRRLPELAACVVRK
jgi:hypothetical protein